MKTLLTIISLFLCLGVRAADINITNVTKANAVPSGSYVLGTTGLVTRLLPTSLLGVGSQVWTNDGQYIKTTQNELIYRVSDGSLSGGLGAPFFGTISLFDTNTFYLQWISTNQMSYELDFGISPQFGMGVAALLTSAGEGTTNNSRQWIGSESMGPVINSTTYIGARNDLASDSGLSFITFASGSQAEMGISSSTNGLVISDLTHIGYGTEGGNYLLTDLFTIKNGGTNVVSVNKDGLLKSGGYRDVSGGSPADVGGITANLTVITNGTDTATLHFTNGVLMSITAP